MHAPVTPVSIMRPASMDSQTRDTFACVKLVTREKTAKKVRNIVYYILWDILRQEIFDLRIFRV